MADLFLTDGAFWLTLLACAVAMVRPGRGPLRHGLAWCVVAAALATLVPLRSVLGFGVSLLALGGVYLARPYRSVLPLLALPLLSPFARYLDSVAGVELRLGLSDAAGRAFRMLGREVAVRGTEIALDGVAFGVDEACAGLHMLLVGLAVALLLLAVTELRGGKPFRLWVAVGVLAATVGLVLISNLSRIIVLVDRGWGPETAWHTWVGLLCFGVYVLVPLAVGVAWLGGQAWATREAAEGRPSIFTRMLEGRRFRGLAFRATFLLGVGALFAFAKTRPAEVSEAVRTMPQLCGQTPELREHDVLAYRFADALVYHKPIPAFYNAEHSPLICWRGSGYEIVDIRKERLGGGGGGQDIYRGTLRRDGHQLQTAWWMSNGEQVTVEQWTWRSEMATGAPAFALVNVTAVGEPELMCWVEELVKPSAHATSPTPPLPHPSPR